jgi:hypothetical protein
MRDRVGQIGVAEAGVEDRDPRLLGGYILVFDPCDSACERAGGVEFVVAVLDHRAGRSLLPDSARFHGDEVAGPQMCSSHEKRFPFVIQMPWVLA